MVYDTGEHPWFGLPGNTEPLPSNDASEDWPTEINTDDDGIDEDDD